MATTVEALMFKFLGDTSGLDDASKKTIKNLDMIALKVGAVGAGMTAFFGGIIGLSLKSAGNFEQQQVAFETMLGSLEAANELLDDLSQFSAQTPFQLTEITQAARGLVLFGESGDQLMDTLEILGNAAAGTGSQFGEIALIFNQIRGVGKLMQQDFRQLSTRGVLSLQDIADHFGVTKDAAQEMMTAGEIAFEDVRSILENLSSEGGRFEDMMSRQSETFLGMISTIKDNISIILKEIGQTFLPIAVSVSQAIMTMVQSFTNLPGPIKTVTAVMLALGAALGATLALLGPLIFGFNQVVQVLALMGVTVTGTTAKIWLMNAAVRASKGLLIGAAAAGAAYLGYKLGETISNWAMDMEEFNAELEKNLELTSRQTAFQREDRAQEIQEIQGISDPEKRALAASEAYEKARRDVAGMQFAVAAAEEEVESMAATWKSLWLATGDQEVAQMRLDEMTARLEEGREHMRNLEKEATRAGDALKIPSEEDAANAEKYLQTLKDQVATLGMTADEARRWKLEQEGINRSTIEAIEDYQNRIAQYEEDVKAAEEAEREKQRLFEERIRQEEQIARQRARDIDRQREEELRKEQRAAEKAAEEQKRQMEEAARLIQEQQEMEARNLEEALMDAQSVVQKGGFDITAEGLTFGFEGDAAMAETDQEKQVVDNTKKTAVSTENIYQLLLTQAGQTPEQLTDFES